MKIETRSVHSGRSVDPSTKAIIPPIYLSTTFERSVNGDYPAGYSYTRDNNPNRESLEKCITDLENGFGAAAFSSGSAAAMSVFQTLSPGDHLIAPDDLYHGNRKLIKLFAKWEITFSFIDMTSPKNVEKAITKNTKLIWIETPSNPMLKITDLQSISQISHAYGAVTICDNTWGTPVLQQPFKFGIDLILHATTKYLGGHSDVLGGIVISKEDSEIFKNIKQMQKSGGAVPSPFECWLVLRGIQTLPLRIRYQSESAFKIAEFLNKHPCISKVYYPGLPTHPGHQTAANQMKLYGGMISFQINGSETDAMNVAAGTRVFTRATSLGGTESLIEHRASVEGADSKTPVNLLRLSIGLEHPDDLITDLSNVLKKCVK